MANDISMHKHSPGNHKIYSKDSYIFALKQILSEPLDSPDTILKTLNESFEIDIYAATQYHSQSPIQQKCKRVIPVPSPQITIDTIMRLTRPLKVFKRALMASELKPVIM